MKVREGGRVVKVAVLVAAGVNADGYREILCLQMARSEDGAGWLAFFRDLVARGLPGVKLVTSDAQAGLVAATGATLPGASWQRCRTHYAANLMQVTPKTSWPWVKTLLQTIFDQHDADAVHAQFARVLDALEHKLPGSDVVGIFPDPNSIIRLMGAVLAEQNDEWTESRRYFGLPLIYNVGHPH